MKGFRFGYRLLACAILFAALAGTLASIPLAEAQPEGPTQAMTRHPVKPASSTGKQIYQKWCGDCHSTPTGPGSMALQRKFQGSLPAILEQRSDLQAEYIRLMVRRGVSYMPSFRRTEISDEELALLAAYLVKQP